MCPFAKLQGGKKRLQKGEDIARHCLETPVMIAFTIWSEKPYARLLGELRLHRTEELTIESERRMFDGRRRAAIGPKLTSWRLSLFIELSSLPALGTASVRSSLAAFDDDAEQ